MARENSGKAWEMRSASIDEAAGLLREIAGNRGSDESLKAVFRRLSRKLPGWSGNRVRDVWRRDPRIRVRAEEVEQLRAIAQPGRGRGTTFDELAELRATVERLARYEALLQRIDAEFFSPEISAAGDQIGSARPFLGKPGVRLRP